MLNGKKENEIEAFNKIVKKKATRNLMTIQDGEGALVIKRAAAVTVSQMPLEVLL